MLLSEVLKKVILLGVVFLIFSCQNSRKSENVVLQTVDQKAKARCGSCHLYPDPKELSKSAWKEVLQNMAARHGILLDGYNPYKKMAFFDQMVIQEAGIYPSEPTISQKDWKEIEQYYYKNAPDTLVLPQKPSISESKTFKLEKVAWKELPIITAITTTAGNVWLGDIHGSLFRYSDTTKKVTKMGAVGSAITQIKPGQNFSILCAGNINPNAQAEGYVLPFNKEMKTQNRFLEGLQRPVSYEEFDFNNDGEKEFIVAEFGYETGSLSFYKKRENIWVKSLLSDAPGAERMKIYDWNADGLQDIIVLFGQARERLSVFINNGRMKFEEQILLQFSPLHGVSDFQIVDWNRDRLPDIVLSNGDNADFSPIFKPYHGISIYLNNGQNLAQKYFYPMAGAFNVRVQDFDLDGDFDMAASSFFPASETKANDKFVYFQNSGQMKFEIQTLEGLQKGKWMTMETGDIDKDGDVDLVLGSFNLVLRNGFNRVGKEEQPLFILRNQSKNLE